MITKELESYLETHNLSDSNVRHKYRITINDKNEIEIPVRDREGRYLFSKFRVFGVPKMKYRYQKGSSMALYNSHLINHKTETIYLVEGEFDAIALQEFMGANDSIAVVSSTGGAGSFNLAWLPLFEGKEVTIIYDNDGPGIEGAVRVFDKLNGVAKKITIGFIPSEYKDVCEYLYKSKDKAFTLNIGFTLYQEDSHRKQPKRKQRALVNKFFELIESHEFHSRPDIDRKLFMKMRDLGKQYYDSTKVVKIEKVDTDDIETLKKLPITRLVTFRNKVAPCIFHEDRNPSMYYNDFNSKFPNTVKCYACGKFADVIDVVMTLNNCSFTQALEILRK